MPTSNQHVLLTGTRAQYKCGPAFVTAAASSYSHADDTMSISCVPTLNLEERVSSMSAYANEDQGDRIVCSNITNMSGVELGSMSPVFATLMSEILYKIAPGNRPVHHATSQILRLAGNSCCHAVNTFHRHAESETRLMRMAPCVYHTVRSIRNIEASGCIAVDDILTALTCRQKKSRNLVIGILKAPFWRQARLDDGGHMNF